MAEELKLSTALDFNRSATKIIKLPVSGGVFKIQKIHVGILATFGILPIPQVMLDAMIDKQDPNRKITAEDEQMTWRMYSAVAINGTVLPEVSGKPVADCDLSKEIPVSTLCELDLKFLALEIMNLSGFNLGKEDEGKSLDNFPRKRDSGDT